ncbi:DEKNAAC100127 [Brettanomyces naardenensis]|uniref:HECT-type E3 ubiquitin transferase n=1 Tax=Brettanomyces naardenensis TaxID=13370 RepID=A0A448YFK1_BRENA|nr:DEKNAAC100127 [Brettanomyces naardenensis]
MTALQAPMKSWWMALYVFEETYSYVLSVSHDSDLFAKGRLSKANYISFVKFLKHLVVLAVLEFRKFRKQQDDLPLLGYFKNTVLLSLKLLRQIYMRNLRLNLFEADFWYLKEDFSVKSVLPLLQQVEDDMGFRIPTPLFGNDLSVSSSSLSSSQLGSVLVLAYIPYMIPFEQRAALFHALIDLDRTRMGGWFAAKTQGTVSRQNILFDAFEQFGSLPGEQFKRPISVEFINRFGEREAGIDGGGLTKELLTSLVTSAFIPSKENASQNGGFRFFDTTTDSQLFPSADYFLELKYAQLHPEQTEYSAESRDFTLQMLRFLGMVVGKCLYENVLIDVSFAPFFLNRWSTAQGRRNFMGAAQTVEESQRYRNSFDDLQSFDGELYQSLVKLLKFSKEELESLDITFTVTERLGKSHNVTLDLLPGGSHLHVTSENKLQYVYCVAKYKLDQRIGVQTAYFLDGLFQVIRSHWLSLFNPYELQTLISGGEKEIDVDDLKRNIVLGGYTTSDSTVKYLFEILREFSPEQKGKFVKFVTSSSKQPLLGFKELNPKFGIRNSGNDPERLPTASTCVNLLKLPDYRDKELLRRKLLYSINAEAGFDLS